MYHETFRLLRLVNERAISERGLQDLADILVHCDPSSFAPDLESEEFLGSDLVEILRTTEWDRKNKTGAFSIENVILRLYLRRVREVISMVMGELRRHPERWGEGTVQDFHLWFEETIQRGCSPEGSEKREVNCVAS
jgi:hypothetical protein